MTLKQLLEELATSAAYAAHRAAEVSLEHYLSHYHTKDHATHEGEHAPKTHGFTIGQQTGVVPEPALVAPTTATLQRFKVAMESDIDEGDGGLVLGFTRGLLSRKSHVKIEAEFAVEPAPEGVQIVQEGLHVQARKGMKLVAMEEHTERAKSE